MTGLLDLWLPIVVSSVVVFIASGLAWMVLPHHKPDIKGLPDEDGFLDALRSMSLKPGQYMYPFCSCGSDMKDPEFNKKYEAGPHGMIIAAPGAPSFGRNLLFVFIFYLVVGFFVAYIASITLAAGDEFARVFRVTGPVAILAYAFGMIPNALFFGRTFRSVSMDVLDGVVYGLLTAAIFGIFWPAAETPTLPI